MDNKTKYLRQYLLIFGLLNIFVISFTVPILLGDWLLCEPRNFAVEMMMSRIYLAMGIVILRCPRMEIVFNVCINAVDRLYDSEWFLLINILRKSIGVRQHSADRFICTIKDEQNDGNQDSTYDHSKQCLHISVSMGSLVSVA